MGYRKSVLLISLIIIFTSLSISLSSISTVPGYIDVEESQGAMEPGEEFEISIFISVDSEEPVIIEPSYEAAYATSIWEGYLDIDNSEYSEEDISDWVSMEDTILVDPDEEVDEDFVSANKELLVSIDIPEDAEPGYHAGQINLEPRLEESEATPGANAFSTSRSEFAFKVEGNAERNIEFSDIQAVRVGENRVQLLQQYENTGTVTTTVDGGTVNIVNDEGRKVGEVTLPSVQIEPGEFEEVENIWNNAEEGGEYQLDGTADYITGQAYVGGEDSSFVVQGAIRDAINVENVNDDLEEESGSESNSLWLVIMVLVLLGVLLYSMDIDPFWIVLILGIIGISAIIILTGIPNWVLGILIIASGSLIYLS